MGTALAGVAGVIDPLGGTGGKGECMPWPGTKFGGGKGALMAPGGGMGTMPGGGGDIPGGGIIPGGSAPGGKGKPGGGGLVKLATA